MTKHRTIAEQKIAFDKTKVMKAGSTYTANNGATVILKSFFLDYDGALYVGYSASHPDMDGGKWAAGDKTPNEMYHWLWSAA